MSMVLSERRGSLAILTLNNPAQYNALAMSLVGDLNAALDAALEVPAARAIVLTGAGKGFCSGAQFGGNTFSAGAGVTERMRDGINPVIDRMRSLPIPIVVAVNGAAITTSPASAIPTPAPAAAPLTATTMGIGMLRILSITGLMPSRMRSVTPAPALNVLPPNCAPEQKPLPAPVSTMARAAGASSAASSAAFRSPTRLIARALY